MKRFSGIAVVAALSLITLSSCSGGSESASSSSSTASSAAATASATPVELNVFAAASLNKAFPEIADTVLKESDPNIKVTFNFQGSSTLVDQMKEGAPADVFASADQKNMTKASDAKLVDAPKPFASNVLTLIVPKGNPAKITGLDSSLDGKKLVVCAQGVPCGNATKQLAEKLGFTLNPVSEEQKVTDVRAKVESGEADAGLVYATDAKAAGDKVETIEVARANEVVNSYPIALTVSIATTAISAFIGSIAAFLGGRAERAILAFIHFMLIIPSFLLVALLVAGSGGDWKVLTVVLIVIGWMYPARIVWSLAISIREREYVKAARFMGVSGPRIVIRHIIPNIGSLLIVNATLGVVTTVMSETGLSFLGLGVKLPDISLGNLLTTGANSVRTAAWTFWAPAITLVLLTVSMALIADGLRDALDPNSSAGGRA